MQRSKNIPVYFITKRNLFIQILFTTIFAFVFINVYKPFGARSWYDITQWQFLLYSGLLVLSGMLVVIVSRICMYQISKRKEIPLLAYSLTVAGEILFMGALFAIYEKFILHDFRDFIELLYVAVGNTSLILLIPYIISLLFFAVEEKNFHLERLRFEKEKTPKPDFIPFQDENGVLRITLKRSDVLFLESNENYVLIHYLAGENKKEYLLRNNLKKLEGPLKEHLLIRCHRSNIVNIDKVKLMQKTKRGIRLTLNDTSETSLMVSKTYVEPFLQYLSLDALPYSPGN